MQEEATVRANGYRRAARRAVQDAKAHPIGKKTSTTNAHDDYSLRPVSKWLTLG